MFSHQTTIRSDRIFLSDHIHLSSGIGRFKCQFFSVTKTYVIRFIMSSRREQGQQQQEQEQRHSRRRKEKKEGWSSLLDAEFLRESFLAPFVTTFVQSFLFTLLVGSDSKRPARRSSAREEQEGP